MHSFRDAALLGALHEKALRSRLAVRLKAAFDGCVYLLKSRSSPAVEPNLFPAHLVPRQDPQQRHFATALLGKHCCRVPSIPAKRSGFHIAAIRLLHLRDQQSHVRLAGPSIFTHFHACLGSGVGVRNIRKYSEGAATLPAS